MPAASRCETLPLPTTDTVRRTLPGSGPRSESGSVFVGAELTAVVEPLAQLGAMGLVRIMLFVTKPPLCGQRAMTPPDSVLELVERFEHNRQAYRSGHYNETQVRREFIDPFFEALGWDVANKQGYAEAYKDVVHEETLKVGGGTKAPDYGFRIGGARHP